jgi:hypothetical protein
MSASANLTGDLPPNQREGFYWGPRLKASAFGCDAPQQVARWPCASLGRRG